VFKLRKDRLAPSPQELHPTTLDNLQHKIDQLQHKIKANLFEVQWTPITEQEIKNNAIPPAKYSQILKVAITHHPNLQPTANRLPHLPKA